MRSSLQKHRQNIAQRDASHRPLLLVHQPRPMRMASHNATQDLSQREFGAAAQWAVQSTLRGLEVYHHGSCQVLEPVWVQPTQICRRHLGHQCVICIYWFIWKDRLGLRNAGSKDFFFFFPSQDSPTMATELARVVDIFWSAIHA